MPRKAATAMSLIELESLLRSRKEKIAKLQKERDKLAKKLAMLDSEITSAGGSVNGATKGGRARNAKSLNGVLMDVLKGKSSMRVADIADAALAAGYRTTSDNFRGIVNQTLIKDTHFTSTGERGMYALKK
jgi:hypothetical protein